MMIVNICKTNLQGSYKLFRHWLTKVTQKFLAAYAFIHSSLAQITQPFKLCIFLQLLLRVLNQRKKGTENTNRNTKEVILIKVEDGPDVWLHVCTYMSTNTNKFLPNTQTYRKDLKSYLNEHFTSSNASTVMY